MLFVSVRGFSQVTMSTLNNKIDSLSLSMDSTIFKQKLAPNASYIVLDTLTLPQNSFGFFTIYYCSYDTAQKNTGEGMEEVFITRVGGAYSSSGTTHQVTMAVTQIGGIILVRVDGYGVGDPIRWHEVRQAKISPL